MAHRARDSRSAPDGETLRRFLDHGPVVAFIQDTSGTFLYRNPAMQAHFADDDAAAVHGLPDGHGTLRRWRMVKFSFPAPEGRELVGGLAMDMADLQSAQEQLAESERRYRHLVESSQGLICTHDMEGRLLTVNPAALALTGLTSAQVIGRDMRDLLSPPSRDVFGLYLARMAEVGADAGIMQVRTVSGRVLTWKYRNVRVDEPGKPSYVLGHAQDVTELRDAEEQLRQLAMTDDLTTLFNRRGFLVNGSRVLQEAITHRRSAAVFYLDIDGLKGINDRYGHDAGSALIVSAAEALKNSFRAADVLARIGGDEFVALVIAPPDDVRTITNRLRWHVDKFNGASGHPYLLSLSLGISHLRAGASESLEALLSEADAEMYLHKRPGGNLSGPDSP